MADSSGYKIVLAAVTGDRARVAQEIASAFQLQPGPSAQIVKSAPIILVDGLTRDQAERATRRLGRIRDAGAVLDVRETLDRKLPRLSWPEPPPVLREEAAEAPRPLEFPCPHCGEAISLSMSAGTGGAIVEDITSKGSREPMSELSEAPSSFYETPVDLATFERDVASLSDDDDLDILAKPAARLPEVEPIPIGDLPRLPKMGAPAPTDDEPLATPNLVRFAPARKPAATAPKPAGANAKTGPIPPSSNAPSPAPFKPVPSPSPATKPPTAIAQKSVSAKPVTAPAPAARTASGEKSGTAQMPKDDGGLYNVLTSRPAAKVQRENAARILAEIQNLSPEDAAALSEKMIITVAKGVSQSVAESYRQKFAAAGVQVRVSKQ
ncbi:MAG: hypothetical protein V1809_14845 [Planctomycetota bacterium]